VLTPSPLRTDRDGTIDMVISSCTSPRHCALSIAYNSQIPLCDSSVPDHEACRDPEALCVADPHFSFDLSPPSADSTSAASASMSTIPLSALLPGHELVVHSTAYRGEYPIAPQVGDYNIDGYPDLLIVATKGHDRRAYILQSRPCETGACTDAEVASKRRAFRVVSEGAEALTKITDVESVSWFDVDDDVRPFSPSLLLCAGPLLTLLKYARRARSISSCSVSATRAPLARPSSSRTTTFTTLSSSRPRVRRLPLSSFNSSSAR